MTKDTSANAGSGEGVVDVFSYRGKNLLGVELPKHIDGFSLLQRQYDTSRYARNAFITLAASCAFVFLTIAQASDAAFFTNKLSAKIPIVGVQTPIRSFVIVSSVLLVLVYLYFCLYTSRAVEAYNSLPRIFPDGVSRFDRADSWLLTGVGAEPDIDHTISDRSTTFLQQKISSLAVFGALPVVMFFIWLRVLPLHEIGLQLTLSVCVLAAVLISSYFYRIILESKRVELESSRITSFVPATVIGLLLLSIGLTAFKLTSVSPVTEGQAPRSLPAKIGPVRVTAMLDSERVALVNDNWLDDYRDWSASKEPELESLEKLIGRISPIDLVGINLRSAALRAALLPRVDLSHVDFTGASLADTILVGASLNSAKIVDVSAEGVHLMSASLRGVLVTGSAFRQGADLRWCDIAGSEIATSNFSEARMDYVNFSTSEIRASKFHNASLVGVDFNSAIIHAAEFNKANLVNAKFRTSVLRDVEFTGANLSGADFAQAQFDGVRFIDVDLRNTRGITPEMLKGACSSSDTQLLDALKAAVETCERKSDE